MDSSATGSSAYGMMGMLHRRENSALRTALASGPINQADEYR